MLEVSNQDKLIARLFKDTLIIFLLSMLVAAIGTVVDGVIIGNYLGTTSLAAFGLTLTYQKFTVILPYIIALGMQILCAKNLGLGNVQEANRIFSLAITAAVCIAIFITGATFLFMEPLLDLLGAQIILGGIRDLTVDYLQSYSLGLPGMAVVIILTPIMQLDNDRRRAAVSVTVMTVGNIIGDLISVELDGGLFGIGIATAVSNWIGAGFLLLHFLKPEANFSFSLSGIKLKIFHEMLFIGSPIIFGRVAGVLQKRFFNHITATLAGGAGIAAYAIFENLSGLLQVVPKALAATTQMLAGILVGEKDRGSLIRLMKFSIKFSLTVTTILAVIVFISAPFLTQIYTRNDPRVYSMTLEGIRWFASGLPLLTLLTVMQYFYQAYGRFKMVSLLSVLDAFGFLASAALFLTPHFKMSGVWMAFPLTGVFYLLTLFIIAYRFHGRFPTTLEDYLLLPDDFDVAEDSHLDITVTNKAEVLGLSERAQIFCRSRGIDRRRSMFTGICIEEMAGNIVDHGFGDGKNHFVDVRVIVKDSQVTIRIRDDCRSFDPKNWAEIYNSDDPEAHIGIRLVSKIATEFDYVNVLKLNNLIIKI